MFPAVPWAHSHWFLQYSHYSTTLPCTTSLTQSSLTKSSITILSCAVFPFIQVSSSHSPFRMSYSHLKQCRTICSPLIMSFTSWWWAMSDLRPCRQPRRCVVPRPRCHVRLVSPSSSTSCFWRFSMSLLTGSLTASRFSASPIFLTSQELQTLTCYITEPCGVPVECM